MPEALLIANSPAEPGVAIAPGPVHGALSGDSYRADQTLERVRQALAQSETACVVQVIELIRAITLEADQISVQDMADIIGRDLTTMNHLLRTACSVGYNPDGVEITTLPQAVQFVGYDRIRNIAVSLLLLQNADRPWSDDDFEEIATLMLTGALLAEALADSRPKSDSGLCFLSAALRSYGRLLLASFVPEDYREALQLSADIGEAPAFAEVFGLQPAALGNRLLDQSGFPASLMRNLDPVPLVLPEGRPLSPAEESRLIVDYAVGLAELFASSSSKDHFEEQFNVRLAKIGRALNCPRDSLVRALGSVMNRIEGYRRTMHSPVFTNRVVQNIRAFLAAEPFPAPRRRRAHGSAEFSSGERAEFQLRPGLAELTRLTNARPVDRPAGWSLATRLVWRSLDLENCLVLLRQPNGEFTAEYGFGPGLANARQTARLTATERSIFSVSLLRGRDVLIQRPHDPSIAPFMPDWMKPLATGAIIILPAVDKAGTFALLVGIAPDKHTFKLSPRTMEQLQQLRRTLAALALPVAE